MDALLAPEPADTLRDADSAATLAVPRAVARATLQLLDRGLRSHLAGADIIAQGDNRAVVAATAAARGRTIRAATACRRATVLLVLVDS